MSKTITLTEESAINAYKAAPLEFKPTLEKLFEGQVNFKSSWSDVVSWEAFCEMEGRDPMDTYFNNGDKRESAVRKIIAMTKLVNRLKNCKEWVPSYRDSNQRKWIPYFVWDNTLNRGSCGFRFLNSRLYFVSAYAGAGSAFCFSDSESSDFAGKAWLDLYIDATF